MVLDADGLAQLIKYFFLVRLTRAQAKDNILFKVGI
jgi:hypothetical protein